MQVIDFVGNNYRLPVVSYALYLIFVGVFLANQDDKARKSLPAGFIAISLVVLALLRLPTVFVNAAFNPDEAQFLASAIKFRSNLNSLLSADLGTSGPLNGYPLMWPFLFGRDTGFAVAHMTAIALLAVTWLCLMSALRSAPREVRVFLGGATVLFLGATSIFDFLEFSSELVPCALIMFAAATAFAAADERVPLARTLAAGFCLGAVPFAKLQALPLAATIGLVLLAQTSRSRSWRAALLLAASSCLPAARILTPLAAAGGLYDFWMSYIANNFEYSKEGWGKLAPTGPVPAQIVALMKIVHPREIMAYLSGLIGLYAVCAVLIFVRPRFRAGSWRLTVSRPDVVRCSLGALILVAGVLTAALPARPFPHYAYFMIWPATLFAGSFWALARAKEPLFGGAQHLTWALGVLLVTGNAVVAASGARADLWRRIGGLNDPAATFHAEGLLPASPDMRGQLLVWGWASQLYVWSGWAPTTRDAITYSQIWPTPTRDYYRGRMMADLRKDPPDYVIDAVVPGSFGFELLQMAGIASFPDLAQFVSEKYTPVSQAGPGTSCPHVYARSEVAAELALRYVAPVRLSVPAGSVPADAAAFETCLDLTAPAGGTDEITLDLGQPQEISAVEIVNTPGSLSVVATRFKATVRAFAHGLPTMEKTVVAPPYPRPVIVATGGVVADKIEIAVEGPSETGGALTHIRLVRP
jgi:hypothetical protein